MHPFRLLLALLGLLLVAAALPAQTNLLGGWEGFWSRESGQGSPEISPAGAAAAGSLKIRHRGSKDWSVGNTVRLAVQAGEVYRWSARSQGGRRWN
jgi:hypothetical protein